jgi:FAD synthetase
VCVDILTYIFSYTSLGRMENTYPNPDLKDSNGEYKHACKLENELHERDGRVGSSKK